MLGYRVLSILQYKLDILKEPVMTQTLLGRMHAQVHRFNSEVIGLPIPEEPRRLDPARKEWAKGAMQEELTEFSDATTLEDEADALIDLTYFALGRLVEMGIAPGAPFEEVHEANMGKRRGELSKRPNSLGYDAVKPDGWTPPDLDPYLHVTRDDVQVLAFLRELLPKAADERRRAVQAMLQQEQAPFTPKAMAKPEDVRHAPKVVVIGHARHGKDTVCEMLRDEYGLDFKASSMFCAERVIWHLLHQDVAAEEFLAWAGDRADGLRTERDLMRATYRNVEHCFGDRGAHRAFWYEAISWFNDRPTRLAEAIFAEHDVYAGIRNKRELNGVVNAGLADIVIWVDASDRLPPEDASSISVEPWMADFVIDNNGGLEELRSNVRTLMDRLLSEE